MASPVAAQVQPTTPTAPAASAEPAPSDPTGLFPVPPPVDEQVAAVLEAERRRAAVEEARAVAAAENAAAEAVVAAAQGALDTALAAVAAATAVVDDAQAGVDAVNERLRQAQVEVDNRRSRAAEIGVEFYTATGSERDPRTALVVALLADRDVPAASTAKVFRDVVSAAALDDLQAARAQVSVVKKELAAAREVLAEAVTAQRAAQANADLLAADLRQAQKQLADTRATGDKRIAAAEKQAPALGAKDLTGGLGIMGEPLVPAADLAAFVRRTGRADPSIDLDALAATYIAEGRAEGVRSDVAWVQSIIETGWFSFAGSMVQVNDHNYAGIGACDSCSRGLIFDDVTDGVRTQIQLLRTYATKGLKTEDLANPPPRLVPERSYVRGCCGTWMRLSGVWATGPGYGIKILTLYNQLLAFAASRHTS